jgi:hypothetical protein
VTEFLCNFAQVRFLSNFERLRATLSSKLLKNAVAQRNFIKWFLEIFKNLHLKRSHKNQLKYCNIGGIVS